MTDYRNLALLVLAVSSGFICRNVEAGLEGEGIVGGNYATDSRFKYHVSIQLEDFAMCGGAIIANQYILTAAHCVVDEKNRFKQSQLVIVAGTLESNSTDSSVVKVKIEQAFIPRAYKPVNPNGTGRQRTVGDIAVLKLKKGLGLRDNAKLGKLKLPPKVGGEYLSYAHDVGIITGFGDNWVKMGTDPKSNKAKELASGGDLRLKYAEVNIISPEECNNMFYKTIQDTHICGAIKQRDPKSPEGICAGDSGGPLVYNGDTIIGIVSTSPTGCREDTQAAVYTRVSAYVDFIARAMKNAVSTDARVGKWSQVGTSGPIAFTES